MGFKFRKRIKIAPGININLSKSGISTSIGKPGATINIGKKGVKATVGVPGSGFSYSQNLSKSSSQGLVSSPKNTGSLFTKILVGLGIIFMLSTLLNGNDSDVELVYKTVTAKSLRVRSEPSTEANIVNQVIRGDRVIVENNQNGWSLVSDGKIKGWVASKYLTDGTL
ncbi:DUF4236 domain-containing protein [Aliivibrio fischeri]|uniref:DUF4236 domain-containing protein n=1 Tax=Aliivibrio fischeri TaxID=668 RepID=UPI00105D0F02|nr:DUF4236 domain-containing protein [Aliivibrio fischeri]TDM51409.1 DUF4236 domain-containing protein [Aliivibrio fischeri]